MNKEHLKNLLTEIYVMSRKAPLTYEEHSRALAAYNDAVREIETCCGGEMLAGDTKACEEKCKKAK